MSFASYRAYQGDDTHVDAAGTEGRDPVADIKAINKELEAYNPQLLKKPQVIAANKIDAIAGDENEVISALRAEFEPQGIKVFPISAVSGKGLKELLYEVKNLLANCPKEVTVYEPEIDPALSFFKDERTRLRWQPMVHMRYQVQRLRKCSDIQIWTRRRLCLFPEILA